MYLLYTWIIASCRFSRFWWSLSFVYQVGCCYNFVCVYSYTSRWSTHSVGLWVVHYGFIHTYSRSRECREALKRRMDKVQVSFLHQQTLCSQRENCVDFVRWGVTLVSVFQSREFSAIQRSLCKVNYGDWFGTVACCPHREGFRNREGSYLKVPLESWSQRQQKLELEQIHNMDCLLC